MGLEAWLPRGSCMSHWSRMHFSRGLEDFSRGPEAHLNEVGAPGVRWSRA